MVVGFNHNFSYKGQLYHVQTEDSGIKNPHIITLLYRGGTILASKKTSYADIIKVDNLESVVEDLMKSQHREMLRLLKNGDFDSLLGLTSEPAKPSVPAAEEKSLEPQHPMPTATAPPDAAAPVVSAQTAVPPARPAPPSERQEKKVSPQPSPAALSLDDIILSYMVGEDKKK